MNKSKSLIIASSLLLLSCRSAHWVEPPEENFAKEISIHNKDQIERNDLTESEKLAGSFLKAKLFAQEGNQYHSCTRLKYLGKYETFPLKYLAQIRLTKECSFSKTELIERISELFKTTPSWLNEELAQTVLDVSLKNKLSFETAKAALMLSKLKKTKSEKEQYVLMAESHARLTKDQSLIDTIKNEKDTLAPRFRSEIKRENWMEVGRDFEKVRQFDYARKYYSKIYNDKSFTPEERYNAFDRWKLTYKLDRDLTQYIVKSDYMFKTLKKWRSIDFNAWNSFMIDAGIAHARAIWTKNMRSESEKTLLALMKEKVLTNDQTGLIHYVLGAIELEKNRLKEALNYFSKVGELTIKDKDLKNNILWNIGWTLYQLKNYKGAAEKFALYNKTNDDYYFKLRALFWWAKAVQKQGLKNEANNLFDEVIEQDPFGYYGLISHVENGNKLSVLKDNNESGDPDITLEWLLMTGERELARSYLDDLFSGVSDYSKVKALLPLYRRAQHYDGGMTQFFKVPPEKRNDYLEDHIATAYPIAYTSEIAVHCQQRFGLDPALVKAIIRQESAFNTYIRSGADAFGLMQLIPEKAKILGRKLKVPYKTFQDLYDPSINLPLGCALLSEHLNDYDNNIVITAASYNAGESVVKNWLKTRFDGDFVEFIENIPYEETKNYVKLILRNIMIYKRISSTDSFGLNMDQLVHSK